MCKIVNKEEYDDMFKNFALVINVYNERMGRHSVCNEDVGEIFNIELGERIDKMEEKMKKQTEINKKELCKIINNIKEFIVKNIREESFLIKFDNKIIYSQLINNNIK
jgi:hypothetical protein